MAVMCLAPMLSIATPQQEAEDLFKSLSQEQVFPESTGSINSKAQSGVQSYQEYQSGGSDDASRAQSGSLQNMQGMFNANQSGKSKTTVDPIASNLKQSVQSHNDEEKSAHQFSTDDIQSMMAQKHRMKISPDDDVFLGYKRINSEGHQAANEVQLGANELSNPAHTKRSVHVVEEKIREVTCKESAIPREYQCVRSLEVTSFQPPAVDHVVTIYAADTSHSSSNITVNLVTGEISGANYQHSTVNNALGDFSAKITSGPEQVSSAFWAGATDSVVYSLTQAPSKSNGYVAKINITQNDTSTCSWRKSRKRACEARLNRLRGVTFEWKFQVLPHPQLREAWVEGDCSRMFQLANSGECNQIQDKELLSVNEARDIAGYPTKVTRPHWAERYTFQCGGFNVTTNECAVLEAQGCTQIGSRVSREVNGIPVEYEQTFRCGSSGYVQLNELPDFDAEDYVAGTIPTKFEEFAAGDFAEALRDFQVLKEMNAEMKEGLGGIDGSNESNPSIFHGKPKRCSIRGGKAIQNCCDLKGVMKGVIAGGCSEEDKELADAAVTDKRCHAVGDKYCTKHLKYGLGKTCVSWKRAHCCYGSQMALLIHEIARDDPEQQALREYNRQHGISQSWGSGESPNCASLTAEQMSLINFQTQYAKHHLAKLMQEYQDKATQKLEMITSRNASSEGMEAKARNAQENMQAHFTENRQKVMENQLRAEDRPLSEFRRG